MLSMKRNDSECHLFFSCSFLSSSSSFLIPLFHLLLLFFCFFVIFVCWFVCLLDLERGAYAGDVRVDVAPLLVDLATFKRESQPSAHAHTQVSQATYFGRRVAGLARLLEVLLLAVLLLGELLAVRHGAARPARRRQHTRRLAGAETTTSGAPKRCCSRRPPAGPARLTTAARGSDSMKLRSLEKDADANSAITSLKSGEQAIGRRHVQFTVLVLLWSPPSWPIPVGFGCFPRYAARSARFQARRASWSPSAALTRAPRAAAPYLLRYYRGSRFRMSSSAAVVKSACGGPQKGCRGPPALRTVFILILFRGKRTRE